MGSTNEGIARAYLDRNGVSATDEVLAGFDLSKPICVNPLEPGDRLLQFIRNPSHFGQSQAGNWFSLVSASMPGVSIFGGLAGRTPHLFVVSHPLRVLEGTARKIAVNWRLAIGGGVGGATQIYVPSGLLGHLKPLGPAGDR